MCFVFGFEWKSRFKINKFEELASVSTYPMNILSDIKEKVANGIKAITIVIEAIINILYDNIWFQWAFLSTLSVDIALNAWYCSLEEHSVENRKETI